LYPVALELLRHGPSHNQLLSKITDYIALCGNLGAETLRLPFNQLEHERRLDRLSYHEDGRSAHLELEEMAETMADLLGRVPGLAPALSQAKDSNSDMAHLRLVVTPHELALLPFECTNVPKGAPGGTGAKLLLQSAASVSLTREVRGIAATDCHWPGRPRILFAWAAPIGVDGVPFEQHLLALRRALNPWLEPYRGSGGPEEEKRYMVRQVKTHLTILQWATLDDIHRACSEAPYTHVHVLAHGVPKELLHGHQTIGIALHDRSGANDLDIVDGSRLANALRFRAREKGDMPAMVVLATCQSGAVRSLVTYGGSIAHELHVAGVPLVVASQFPLSKDGSVVLADELYRRVFNAEDPRVALHFVRRRLYSMFDKFHDWASLVTYASLPRDFETQLAGLQYDAAKRKIDRLLDDADSMIDRTSPDGSSSRRRFKGVVSLPPDEAYAKLIATLEDLEVPAMDLRARAGDTVESIGMLASTKKRKAEVLFWASRFPQVMDSNQREILTRSLDALSEVEWGVEGVEDSREILTRSLDALSEARTHYQEAMRLNMSAHWVGVQFLGLTLVLHACGRVRDGVPDDLLKAVRVPAKEDVVQNDRIIRAWAYASLAELALIEGALQPDDPGGVNRREAMDNVERMLELVSPYSFEVYSTRRQFARYVDWWSQPLDSGVLRCGVDQKTRDLAQLIVSRFEA